MELWRGSCSAQPGGVLFRYSQYSYSDTGGVEGSWEHLEIEDPTPHEIQISLFSRDRSSLLFYKTALPSHLVYTMMKLVLLALLPAARAFDHSIIGTEGLSLKDVETGIVGILTLFTDRKSHPPCCPYQPCSIQNSLCGSSQLSVKR